MIDTIVAAMSQTPLDETVDTVKVGDPAQPVTGIVTTFLATTPVICEAARLGANLIITHEPTFSSHTDDVAWLAGDPGYAAKCRLLDAHGFVVWRLHDRIHFAHRPDGCCERTTIIWIETVPRRHCASSGSAALPCPP